MDDSNEFAAKALELIKILKNAPPFTSSTCAAALCTFLLHNSYLSDLSALVGNRDVNTDNDFLEIIKSRPQFKEHADNLAGATLSMALSFVDSKDEYGFVDSANKENAIKLANDSLANLVPYLIEAHIDSELGKRAHSSLRITANISEYKAAFLKALESHEVQLDIEEGDVPLNGSNYRANLIFVYEYFRTGSTPFIKGSVPTKEDGNSFADVVKVWLQRTTAPTEKVPFNDVFNKILAAQQSTQAPPPSVVVDWTKFSQDLMQILLPLDVVYLPGLKLNSGLPYIAETVLTSISPNLLSNEAVKKTLLAAIPETTLSFAHELWIDWEKQAKTITKAVTQSINTDTVLPTKRETTKTGALFATEMCDVKNHEFGAELANAQKKCKHVNVWNKSGDHLYPAERGLDGVAKHAGNRMWVEYVDCPSDHSCFIEGTLVWTEAGPAPIEKLYENTRVLTRASSQEYGTTSDERVKIPTVNGKITLYGFNGEPAFVTANHVFFTTTGRRAINPEAARRENPWLEVGHLRVGHVLLHTTDGENYQHTTLQAIDSEEVQCDFVYGLHLREGLRSYHANGYLVHLNYPEITIKSIADSMRVMPQDQQLRMLSSLKELEPVLARFGKGTVMQLLQAEITQSGTHLAAMRHKQPAEFGPPGLFFQNRSFTLRSWDNRLHDLPGEYDLPTVDCYDGQLWLDGGYCDRARISKRGITWSREVREHLWEHVMCTFGDDDQMTAGDGLLWLETDASPSKPSRSGIRFQALSTALRDRDAKYTNAIFEEQTPEYRAFALDSVTVAAAAEAAAEETKDESAQDNIAADDTDDADIRSEKDESKANTAPSQQHQGADSAVFNVENVMESSTAFENREKIIEKLDGPTPLTAAITQTDVVETYDVTCEPDAITDMPSGRDAVLVFQLQKLRKDVSNGHVQFDFAIPALDALTDRLNQVTSNDVSSLKFYETFVTRTAKNEMCVSIEIKQPERLALAADDNISIDTYGDTAKSYQDLTFLQKGVEDLKLPFVFSKFVFNTNTLAGILKGNMIEFNPESVGDSGKWHTAQGKRITNSQPPAVMLPGKESGGAIGGTNITKPAPFLTGPVNAKSVQDLTTGLAINTTDLKQNTQDMLYRTMLYHMHEKDRKEILGIEERPHVMAGLNFVPQEIPPALAEDLDVDTKNWLKDKYALAWTAQNVAGMSDDQKKTFNLKIDQPEQRRLRYFWSGSGKACLARSQIYNNLNTQIATICFRRRYPRVLDYINDKTAVDDAEASNAKYKGMTGGEKWAHLLFDSLMTETMVDQIAKESTIAEITKINSLEKYCTLLNALWIDNAYDKDLGTLPQQLGKAVTASLHRQQLFKHRSIEDPKSLEDGIRDYLLGFFMIILDEAAATAAGIAGEFRKAMVEDMKKFCKWTDDYNKRSARQNAESMLAASSAAVKSAASYATGAAESPQSFQTGVKGLARVFNSVRRAVLGIKGDYSGKGTEIPHGPIEPQPFTGALCFGLGLIMTLTYVKTSWQSWGMWVDGDERLTGLDKVRLVTSALQAFGGLVFTGFKAVQLAKGWDPKNIHQAAEATHAVAGNIETKIRSKSMQMHPDTVLREVDIADRVRSNSVGSKELAVGSFKPRDVPDALLPDAKESIPWRKRMADLKDSAKNKVKGWGRAIRAKCQFNMTETALRGVAAGLSCIMLVLACVTAGQLWKESSPVEKFLTVLNLLVQFANLVIEIATIFIAIPVWVGLAVMIVGLGIALLVNWIVGTPKPPDPPVTAWWREKGEQFFKDLPEEPQTRYDYQTATLQIIPNSDTVVSIICKNRVKEVDNGFTRLKAIGVTFTVSTSETSALFNSKKQVFQEMLSEPEISQSGQCAIALPPSLQEKRKTTTGKEKSVFAKGITNVGTGTQTTTYDLGVDADSDNLPPDQALPSIKLAAGEEITLKMRGIIALPGTRPETDKKDYKNQVPPWRQYELRIVETYADEKDEFQGTREAVISLEKSEAK